LTASRRSHALLRIWKSEESNANVIPAVKPWIPRLKKVVGRTKQEALSLKALEVTSIIIDQKVGGYDTLISTEHDMAVREKWKMLLDPFILRGK
jgi:hypothetical protein